MKNVKLITFRIAVWVLSIILVVGIGVLSYAYGKNTGVVNTYEKLAISMFVENEIIPDDFTNKYSFFIDDEKAEYITHWCENMGLDTDFCISILMKENPEANPEAYHKNNNGSVDCGFWQLNDKYAYTTFKNSYWKFDKLSEPIEFEIFNWQHNTYIALHLISDLFKTFHSMEDVAAAYNCGTGRTLTGNIPESTKSYVKAVMNNYNMLQAGQIIP